MELILATGSTDEACNVCFVCCSLKSDMWRGGKVSCQSAVVVTPLLTYTES